MIKKKQNKFKIPPVTINRLSIYYRYLEKLAETEEEGNLKTISSAKISQITGINSTQVRKDLAYFGEFGQRGIGYPIKNLGKELKKILGLDKEWHIIISGGGNLGKALTNYEGFKKRGFLVRGIFDNNSEKIGTRLNNVLIYDIENMEKLIRKWNIKIGVLAVPVNFSQNIAEKMVAGGIKSILNFAPIQLKLFPEIKINNVDLSIELEGLTYYLNL